MELINETESKLLAAMYEGDKSRDATSTIRGFLFQDYITIMCLLEPKVKYVCSEFLEDVDVFYEDSNFQFIQVKYYPRTRPNLKEITTDLYYQYLRLSLLNSKLKPMPRLFIHGRSEVEKPSLDDATGFLGLGAALPEEKQCPDESDPIAWLKKAVHGKKTKDEQKKALFEEMASQVTLSKFLASYEIVPHPEINSYKVNLMDTLSVAYQKPDAFQDEEHWKSILLGLAVLYVQKRYTLSGSDVGFDKIRIDKSDFDKHMRATASEESEESIVAYLVSVACEKCEEIIAYNNLSDLQISILNEICKSTIDWIKNECASTTGQYKLLNTLSTETSSKVARYMNKSCAERRIIIAECKRDFTTFLSYLWKIMFDIAQENVPDMQALPVKKNFFTLSSYIKPDIDSYICFYFPEDKFSKHSVILPTANGDFTGVRRKIVERIISVSPRPNKWFFENNNSLGRKNQYYDYSTGNIIKNPTVADLEKGLFQIECMECIQIEEGKWHDQEKCNECIFSEKCVKEDC